MDTDASAFVTPTYVVKLEMTHIDKIKSEKYSFRSE
jgi:hypothetical protein